MSSPEPELAAAREQPEDAMEQEEQAGDRYDVTGPEGGDGQPEIDQDEPAAATTTGGLVDVVS